MTDTPGLQAALKIFSNHVETASSRHPVMSPIDTSLAVRVRPRKTRITSESPTTASSVLNEGAYPPAVIAAAADTTPIPTLATAPIPPPIPPPTSPIPPPTSPIIVGKALEPFPIFQYVTAQVRRELENVTSIDAAETDGVTTLAAIPHVVSFQHEATIYSSDVTLPPRSSLSQLSSRVIPGLFPNGVPENMDFGDGLYDFYFKWRDSNGNLLPDDYILEVPHSLLGELHIHLPP